MDPINPVTGIECDSGTGGTATAPSISVPAGAQVLRVYTGGTNLEQQMGVAAGNDIASRAEPQDNFLALATSLEFSKTIAIVGDSVLQPLSGSTGTAQFNFGAGADWRACIIGIRMIIRRDVPTMSEWGLIGFAVLAGITGIWYLLRRKATA